MRIIAATGNKDKLVEFREILGSGVEVISMSEAGADIDIEENGKSFSENSFIKARAVYEHLLKKNMLKNSVIIADDSGLEIDALNKEPGIYSARYLGKDTPYTQKNAIILERLKGVPMEKRTARYICAISAVFEDGSCETVEESLEGYIGCEPRGSNGFGYDPIFYVQGTNKSNAELTLEEKDRISHRGKALRAVAAVINKAL